MPSVYACPICATPLARQQRVWRCINNHSFDEHKTGYLNLLTVQRKRSKAPGDSKAMVLSRRAFLQAGFYRPLANKIAELCQQQMPENARLLDAGCGEGYYTAHIKAENPGYKCYGIDISKPAIQQAASTFSDSYWCVGSSSHPPYLPGIFDAIISVFSRVDSEPFAQILKPGGCVLMVTPDANHLQALRQLIYQTVVPYDTAKHRHYLDSRFDLVDEQSLAFDIHLPTPAAIDSLLGMTPHSHRLPDAARQRIRHLPELQDRACFKLYRFCFNRSTHST